MAKAVEAAGNDVVCGDCHAGQRGDHQETGRRPLHPIQLMARAYGLVGSENAAGPR